MAKRPPAAADDTELPTPAQLERAKLAAAELKRYWDIGCDSLAACPRPDTGWRKHGETSAEAKNNGLTRDTLEKARRAAELITKAEINELCDLIREHGATFGPTHLRTLLAVGNRKLRNKLAKSAAVNRWNKNRLRYELYAVHERAERTGRPTKPEGGDFQILMDLSSRCATLTRFWREAEGSLHSDAAKALGVPVDALEAVAAAAYSLAGDLLAEAKRKRPGTSGRPSAK